MELQGNEEGGAKIVAVVASRIKNKKREYLVHWDRAPLYTWEVGTYLGPHI